MIKICFVGAGRMAEEHLKVFSKIKNVKLVGIVTRTKKKAEKLVSKYPNLKIYENLDKMYSLEKPDGTVVSVSENSLHKVCKTIFKFKNPILIEKPIGCNYDENLKIINLAKKFKKRNCFVALNRRQYSSTKKLIKKLSKDKGVRKIYINDQQFNLKKKYPHKDKIVLDNMMYANSVHLIDYINIVARGKIYSIKTFIEKKRKNVSHLSSILKFSSGDLVHYRSIWNEFSKWGVRIFTNNYFYEMSPLEQLKYFNYKNLKKINIISEINDTEYKPGFMHQAMNFINVIKKKPHLLVTINDNFKTTKLIKKIYAKFK
jgi:predicted dehydrogenase